MGYTFLNIFILLICGYTVFSRESSCRNRRVVELDNHTGKLYARPEDNEYNPSSPCLWHIQAPTGWRIQVAIETIQDLQSDEAISDCTHHDHLSVREDNPSEGNSDEDSTSSQIQICYSPNLKYISSGDNDLSIEFLSNSGLSDSSQGFIIAYKFFNERACAPGWVEDDSLVDATFCYKFNSGTVHSWMEAQQYCLHEQSNLVSFANDTEMQFVKDLVESKGRENDRIWIGLNDIGHELNYTWIDQIQSTASYSVIDFVYIGEHCVTLLGSSMISDSCSQENYPQSYPFICKSNKYGVTQLFDVPTCDDNKSSSKTGYTTKQKLLFAGVVLFIIGCFCSWFMDKRKKRLLRNAAPNTQDNISVQLQLRQEFGKKSDFEAETAQGASPYFTPTSPLVKPPSYDEAVNM